jgi:hypothetical protein
MEQIAPFIFPFYVLLQLLLFVWSLSLIRRLSRIDLGILTIMQLGLLYDNAAIAAGVFLKAGTVLEILNSGRFLFHSLLAPSLIVVATRILLATMKEANHQKYETIAWIVAATLSLFWTGANLFIVMKLAPLGTLLRYTMDRDLTPLWIFGLTPASIFLITFFIAVTGFFVWRRLKWPWLLLGSVFMLIIGGIFPASSNGIVIGNGVEIVFILSILLTTLRVSKYSQGFIQ